MALDSNSNATPQPRVLHLTLPDRQTLYSAYMPFIQGGGLFIPTDKQYQLGDSILVFLNLSDSGERIPVPGRVIWVTPANAQAKRRQGVGIQFMGRGADAVQKKLEAYLGGMLESDQQTLSL